MKNNRFTPASLLARFVGRTFRDMITELATEHGFTITGEELDALVLLEKQTVMTALGLNLQPTAGVDKALAFSRRQGFNMAVVTSSAGDRVQLCLSKAEQTKYFGDERVFSAATSLAIPKGKPAPDIYLHAIERMLKKASECVAVEDSRSGVLSARAAGIEQVIGYIGCYEEHEREEKAAMLRQAGATVIMNEWSEFEAIMAQLPQITTILFDYDNTLGLTESVAFAACCQVVNATLDQKGVSEVLQHA